MISADNASRETTREHQMCLIHCFARSLHLHARTDKSHLEMTRKSPGAAGYEPAACTSVQCGFTNTRINSGFIVPAGYGDWPTVPVTKRLYAHNASRTPARERIIRRLNIRDVYRDNNSVATVALFGRLRPHISAVEIRINYRADTRFHAITRIRKFANLCVNRNIIFKN